MSKADLVYNQVVQNILDNGTWDTDQIVRTKWADGTPAHTISLISQQMVFDTSEVPIITTKKVAWKSAIHELLWFYVHRTSDASYLDEHNVKIWREWTNKHNSIGKAYGYQLGKPIMIKGKITNQVHNVIDELKNNAASRRHVVSLWNIDDLDQMALYPCVWNHQWLVKQGKLHLIVQVRSNDIFLGNCFNHFQYYVLQRIMCQVTGYEIGQLVLNINDAHIYDKHVDLIQEQVKREPFESPILNINPDIKNFDDFAIDDFELVNYQCHPAIKAEVAI
jgi:thymidylate synthase